jgi:hypothetical protein
LSAGAKAQGGVNRVISWVENEVNHSLILHTGSSSPMSAPQIQYLPGSDGKTVMVADFYGLSWIEASKIIRPAPSGTFASIEEVRIGQFQANPPICRVALSTKNPACLKEVSFSSKPGQLVIKWQVAALAQGTSVHQIHTRIPAQTRQTASELGVHQMHTTVPAPAPAAVAQADWQAMPGRKATNQLPASAIRTMSTLPPDAVRTDDQRIDDLINTARRSTIKSGNKSPLHTGNQMPLPAPDIAARSQPDNSEADASGNSDTARTNADRERESDDGSLPGPPMARLTIINGKNANSYRKTHNI